MPQTLSLPMDVALPSTVIIAVIGLTAVVAIRTLGQKKSIWPRSGVSVMLAQGCVSGNLQTHLAAHMPVRFPTSEQSPVYSCFTTRRGAGADARQDVEPEHPLRAVEQRQSGADEKQNVAPENETYLQVPVFTVEEIAGPVC